MDLERERDLERLLEERDRLRLLFGRGGGGGRTQRVSWTALKPQAQVAKRWNLPTWSGIGSRSGNGSRSVTVTWSMSQMTWKTSSWSERRSALGFWICSETAKVRCRERLVSWS